MVDAPVSYTHLGKSFLIPDLGINGKGIKGRQIMAVNKLQFLLHIHVSIEIDKAVGRMIVLSVEIQEFLVTEIRDIYRISAGLTAIGGIREQGIHDLTLQNIIR